MTERKKLDQNKLDFLARYGSEDHVEEILKKGFDNNLEKLASRPDLKKEHIDKLLDMRKPHNDIEHYISNRKDLRSEHIDRLIKSPNKLIRENIAFNSDNLQPHHVDALVNDSDHYTRAAIGSAGNLQPHHFEKLLKDNFNVIGMTLLNKNIPPEHLHKFSNHPNPSIKITVSKHPNLSNEDFDRLVDDENSSVRLHMSEHKRTSIEQLRRLASHEDFSGDMARQHLLNRENRSK